MATKSKIFFVMEYVKGSELFNKVAKDRLKEEIAKKYFQQLISAVSFCHAPGVYHRDLKPEYILLDEDGNLKASGFGLSAISEETKQDGLFHTFCALLLNSQMPFPATSLTTQATDQSALLALRSHLTLDPYRVITRNWTNSSFVYSWIGVTCNSCHHRVAALNVFDTGLVGTIPPQLGNLSFLVSPNLRTFSTQFAEEMSLLHRLKFIALNVKNFSGEVPMWFGFLPKLQFLSLKNNSFTGFILYSISNLSNLELLDFSSNSLQGNIPEELGKLKSLDVLSMRHNHLSGSIPSAIFNLSNLKTFAFTSNTLSGILPSDICCNLPFLKGICLSDNHFSGQIPSNLSQCSQLQIMSLSDNYFSGQIPGEIGKLTSLQILYLGGNNINSIIYVLLQNPKLCIWQVLSRSRLEIFRT
ncbi:hypothetical protein BUALT_Bualt18G0063200 [Buddleja alternifolia]|uniref:Protein kinase domain-containing protein n=1 Tax=Buddleja alternifolia TaxID=168488 RepID=A0AAV6WDF4_9LAMI|nr:hypothetical protein BUALT_Bualt18G0063200 [Buddleja alternifolia]